MDTSAIQRRRWLILGVLVLGLLAIVIDNTVLNVAVAAAIAAAMAVLGAIAVSRWMPGRSRPSVEEMEALVALEIEAAERDLSRTVPARAARNSNSSRLERSVASPVSSAEPIDG